MIGVLHRNHEGVILRYADPGAGRRISESLPRVADLARIDLIRGERALPGLYAIADALNVPEFAREAIIDRLELVRRALRVKRLGYGMPPLPQGREWEREA